MIRDLEHAAQDLTAPRVVLFDWHATLVDTRDAMYHAVNEMLPRLRELGLHELILPDVLSRSAEDARLAGYVREHLALPPRILREQRISRTDIFEILFGHDEDAKHIAHEAFNEAYRNHYGEVHPFDGNELVLLRELDAFDIKTGILTNREREFFEHEFALVEDGAWLGLFDTTVCGGDTFRRKPNPAPIYKALVELRAEPGADCWYLGDSSTDVAAAKRAGITAVFFNGAGWPRDWLEKVFPGTPEHPYQPDAVVDTFAEFRWLVEERLEITHQ
ncbi:MAG: HAD family hydrolase [Gammaproteobacteria bacterium]